MDYELTFSDKEMGHKDLGYIPRRPKRDPEAQADDEDVAYARFLRSKGHKGVSVRHGLVSIRQERREPVHFKDIPQFPRAHYQVDVSWDYLADHIEHHTNQDRYCAPLDLEPDLQRAHVWTQAQQIAYVEYILRGGEVGRNLTFNCPGWMYDWRGPYVIVDGKQRLRAARAFLSDEIPAFGLKRSEYSGRLSMTGPSFCWRVCTLDTRRELLEFYLSINAGGTPHTKAELDKVRKMLADAE